MRTSVIGGGGAAGSGNPMGPVGGGVGGGFVPFRRASFSLRDVDDHAEAPPATRAAPAPARPGSAGMQRVCCYPISTG